MDNDNNSPPDNEDNIIVFPGGTTIDPDDFGMDYIVGGSGTVPTGELIDPADIKRELRDRVSFVKNQQIVKSLADNDASLAMDALLVEIAEEISHMKWERRKAAKDGKSTAQYAISRINGLKILAETLIRRKEASLSEGLDLKSPKLQKIFKIWMQFFYESMEKSNVSPEIINVVFQQMKVDIVGWEKRMDSE